MSAQFSPRKREPGDRDRLLIVDDTDLIRDFLHALFSDTYDVTLAHNGSEAVDKASVISPTVAIVDYGMPGMTGDLVARRIAGTSPDTILILHSAQSFSPDDPVRSLFDFYVQKPVLRIVDLERTVKLAVALHEIRNAEAVV